MENAYRIIGGTPLFGKLDVGGAKNAALPILFATLLLQKGCELINFPFLRDTEAALALLTEFGVTYTRTSHRICLQSNSLSVSHATARCREIRAGIYLLGAALARFGQILLPLPGGCNFGVRPIDYHITAMQQMGAHIHTEGDILFAECDRLRGADIHLPRPSVGATVNILLAAVTAQGETCLYGGAVEPHILDLVRFLRAGGADIEVGAGGFYRITGVAGLKFAQHRLIGDSIEAGTYLAMAAATRGRVTVSGIDVCELSAFRASLEESGVRFDEEEGSLTADAYGRLSPITLTTAPYPGFPTDLQPPAAAFLSTVKGESRICEAVWKNRFAYAEELRKMGISSHCIDNTLFLQGGTLTPAEVQAPDLRGGAALLIAALAARGESRLSNAILLSRGYEDLLPKLRILGADVKFI